MTLGYLAVFLAGAAAGGFINGLAGFGTALLALGFWLQIMEPTRAVAIVVVMSVLSGLQGLWIVRQAIADNPQRLLRFLLPALPGVFLGVGLLATLDATALKIAVGAFCLLYGGFFIARRSLPVFSRATPVGDSVVGFAGGILGGAASLSGVLPTMWCALRPWPKAEQRAVLQPFNVAVLGLTVVVLAFQGVYDRTTLIHMAIALPITMIAAQIGIAVFQRLTDSGFRRLLIVLLFISGVAILARELF